MYLAHGVQVLCDSDNVSHLFDVVDAFLDNGLVVGAGVGEDVDEALSLNVNLARFSTEGREGYEGVV